MRPDRIVVGECRSGEALDMLQAMNTGHDGSMSTGHANTPRDMLARLETMVLMAGVDLPVRAIREQIASAVDLIVHQSRLKDGTRKIVNITEVQGMEGDIDRHAGRVRVRADRRRSTARSRAASSRPASGPKFVEKFEVQGIHLPPGLFGFTLLAGQEASMDTMTLVIAALAAARDPPDRARHRDVRRRVGRQRSSASSATPPAPEAEAARPAGPGWRRRAHPAKSAALAQLNKVVEQRDFGANLLRDLGARRPQAQAVRVPRHLGRLHDRRAGRDVPAVGFVVAGAPEPARAPASGLLIGFMLPRFWLGRRKSGRLNAFNKQLPDTITLIANALRAGSSFLQAIELVVRESRPPISTEFGRVIREVNLGLPFERRAREHGPARASPTTSS